MAGRPCTVCTHPMRVEIDDALLRGDSLRTVAEWSGLNKDSLARHFKNHVQAVIIEADATIARRAKANACRLATGAVSGKADRVRAALAHEAAGKIIERVVDIEGEKLSGFASAAEGMRRLFDRTARMFEACERELADPDRPDELFLGPRAMDIRVGYWWYDDDGKLHKAADTLQNLIDRALSAQALDVGVLHWNGANPGAQLLDAAKVLGTLLTAWARLQSEAPPHPERPGVDDVDAATEELITVVIEALAPYPEARAAVVEALAGLVDSDGSTAATVGNGPVHRDAGERAGA